MYICTYIQQPLSRYVGGKRQQLLVGSCQSVEEPTVALAFERLYGRFLLIVSTAVVRAGGGGGDDDDNSRIAQGPRSGTTVSTCLYVLLCTSFGASIVWLR